MPFSIVSAVSQRLPIQTGKYLQCSKVKALQRSEVVGLHLRTGEKLPSHHISSEDIFKPSPNMTILTAPFRCTYPLSLSHHYCLWRTYLQRTLLEVTLQGEILTMSNSSVAVKRFSTNSILRIGMGDISILS